MSPIIIAALAAGGIFLSKVVYDVVTLSVRDLKEYGKKVKKEAKDYSDKKKKYKKSSKELSKQKVLAARARAVSQAQNEIAREVIFKGIKSGKKSKLVIKEDTSFDIKKDVVIKGKLTRKQGSETVTETIYLFQPRVSTKGAKSIGPKVSDGALNDKFTYLCKTGDSEEILTGYVPKREVLTGIQFDFDSKGIHPESERCEFSFAGLEEIKKGSSIAKMSDYIDIEFERDEKGNIKTVDLTNKNELTEFSNYIKKAKTDCKVANVTMPELFSSKVQNAIDTYILAVHPELKHERAHKHEVERVVGGRAYNYGPFMYGKGFMPGMMRGGFGPGFGPGGFGPGGFGPGGPRR